MEGPDWQNKDKEMETAVRGSLENGPSTSSTRLHLVMLAALNGRRTSISLSMPSISTRRRITASPPSAFFMVQRPTKGSEISIYEWVPSREPALSFLTQTARGWFSSKAGAYPFFQPSSWVVMEKWKHPRGCLGQPLPGP